MCLSIDFCEISIKNSTFITLFKTDSTKMCNKHKTCDIIDLQLLKFLIFHLRSINIFKK